jgi:hypothetical protein
MAGDIKKRVVVLKHWVQVADVCSYEVNILMVAMCDLQQLFWIDVHYFGSEFYPHSSFETDLGNGTVKNDANIRRSQ